MKVECSCGAIVAVRTNQVGRCPRCGRGLMVKPRTNHPRWPWVTAALGVAIAASSTLFRDTTIVRETSATRKVVPEPVMVVAELPAPPILTTFHAAEVELSPPPRKVEVVVAPPPRDVPAHEVVHTLAKRLDTKTTADLEDDLRRAKEVSLNTPGSRTNARLLQASHQQSGAKKPYVGALMLAPQRPDIAGLPFRMGDDCKLDTPQATERNARELRSKLLKSAKQTEPVKALHTNLSDGWMKEESVSCVSQIMQAENSDVRRQGSELLRYMNSTQATDALVQWAVFDTEPANRAAAVDALKRRDRGQLTKSLTKYLRYPWLPAVEHASEALVALELTEAIPAILAAKGQPDPDATYEVKLPHGQGGLFRQQVVRINHAKNCVMCHTPSQGRRGDDSLVATVPDEGSPLPPSNSVEYYSRSGELIAASTTYLRQDFSLVQPVEKPGPWPKMQRFDFFVTTVRETHLLEPTAPVKDSGYQRAYDFALNGLGAAVPDVAFNAKDLRLAETAQFVSLQLHPEALNALKNQPSLLSMKPSEVEAVVIKYQHQHGLKAHRVALVAYLAEALEKASPEQKLKAELMLAAARGGVSDMDLSARIARMAR